MTVFLPDALSLSRDLVLSFLESGLSGLLGWVVESESVWRWVGFGDDEDPLVSVVFLVRETLAASLLPGGPSETYVLVSSIGFPYSSASSMYVRVSTLVGMVGGRLYGCRLLKVSLVESWMKVFVLGRAQQHFVVYVHCSSRWWWLAQFDGAVRLQCE